MSRRAPARGGAAAHAPGSVRIIGGRWRGTRLPVPGRPGLRPTSDRVRETLFNWLMPALPGARVLDLFAGSGALGLEAVSRGAAQATLVERDPALAAALDAHVQRLGARERVRVVNEDALRWLDAPPDGLATIAFVDPPFAAGLWEVVLPALVPRLEADAWVYVESPAAAPPPPLPAGWRLHRELRTAQSRAALYRGPGMGRTDTLDGTRPAP
ncbi:16S rRNA (guanine(966)-N(2))-methyltransferase RsmD [Pseudoxanthomonas broegbernensis]|uniref:Ribosomal RNA small subunit methyltransferase D n=1 Tax=Pseudoxanthomonas broegbernensis TaxID=83619 RepID=A0A7V8GQB9_9GAMM|nr:16S rRNA (guanine(966)-N(2))-methyltransferase RsmD [Pseudoxanthomonas broegbernensis]KAF1688153.1 16S rRNA (guanine(966)-N(2))-methyltransferase RsmD [Pseudoxanthomonas broegbernensis]MBB6065203.1 16S rRNA (guanine966-N2)-methyltransferase [Pseudoxanthomonas broegbernensis]